SGREHNLRGHTAAVVGTRPSRMRLQRRRRDSLCMNLGGSGRPHPRKARRIVSDTREWTSGMVRFAVIEVEGHPERTYIRFEQDLIGIPASRAGVQRFNLRLRDWNNLKRLIEDELAGEHRWVVEGAGLRMLPSGSADLVRFLDANPGLVE